MGTERGVVGSHAPQLTYLTWLGVIFFLSVHQLKLVGMPIGIKPGYVASGWAWHSRQVTCKSMEWFPQHVSFDPSNVLPWAWQEVKGEAMPLSEQTTAVRNCWQQG